MHGVVSAETPAVRFRGVSKRYPGIVALREVSFDVARGSCHAICGENGAGKSTLGRILAGVGRMDAGSIEIDGREVDVGTPRAARAAGVAMVHQELAFCENMTVADNLCLADLPSTFGFVNTGELHRRASEMLSAVGATIDPSRLVSSLSVAEQQLVQIASAVGEGARIIVLDEPTSSLGATETQSLYALMASLRARGVTLLFVSHRMAEIFQLCDTITVLRDGAHVSTQPASAFTESTLVAQMIGRELAAYYPSHVASARGEERLRVVGLSSPGRFTDVSFSVHAGEVVGLAGLVGAGRSEVAAALFGLDSASTGQVHAHGRLLSRNSPRDAIKAGIGLVPEDRKKQGLVLSMCARENGSLPSIAGFARAGWIDHAREAAATGESFRRVAYRGSPEAIAGSLSGGNQQKLVLAKWLTAGSDILLLDEPTRGVDVAAKAELHQWIDQRVSQGAAVLLISSELPELLHVSTRIIVLREGRVQGELQRADATQERLLRLMTGLS